jgi:NAD(P)H dehydrogenase (quinone)
LGCIVADVVADVAKAAHFKLNQAAPIAAIADLVDYDAIVVGIGTRFGRMSSQTANFLDQAGALWPRGALQRQMGGIGAAHHAQSSGESGRCD